MLYMQREMMTGIFVYMTEFSDPQHPLQPTNKKWINEKNEFLRSACDLLEFPPHKLASP